MPSPVVAVVVTYQPTESVLIAQLDKLSTQVARIIIVDNASDPLIQTWLMSYATAHAAICELIILPDNMGIAEAQNQGIARVRALAFPYVLLMDQDSQPEPDMVAQLLQSYQSLRHSGIRVAVIGAMFRDSISGQCSEHIRYARLRIARVSCQQQPYLPVDFVIASGSLIGMDALAAIGDMDARLFIDHVDTEWVLRAKSLGWQVYGHCGASMTHSLGEARVRVWFGRWREVPLHHPFRYYYIFRNSILLYRRAYTGWHWKWLDIIRLLQMMVFMGVFIPGRRQRWRFILRGIVDGLRGISGRLPHDG